MIAMALHVKLRVQNHAEEVVVGAAEVVRALVPAVVLTGVKKVKSSIIGCNFKNKR